MIFDLGYIFMGFNYMIGGILAIVFGMLVLELIYFILMQFFAPEPMTPDEYAAEMQKIQKDFKDKDDG